MVSQTKPIEIGELLVVLDKESRKKIVGEVVAKHKDRLKLESVDKYGTCETHDITVGETHSVQAYLGAYPSSGTVYGCQVRKLYGQSEHPFWGVITFFRQMDDEEKEVLKVALKSSQKRLKILGLEKIITIDNLVIMESKGKYAGYYIQDRQGSHILYHPKEIEAKFSTFLMDHELAHAIWSQALQDSAKATWVRLYTEYVEQTKTPEDNLAQIVEILTAEARYLDEYYDLVVDIENGAEWLEKIEYALMDMLLLDRDSLDLYIWSSKRKERAKLIQRVLVNVPPLQSDYSEKFPISEYARKNVYEFFAEAYCHYISMPYRVPADVEALLEECIPNIKNIKGTAIIKEEDDADEDEYDED